MGYYRQPFIKYSWITEDIEMNQKIYDLVVAILNSRLSPQTQEEIIRFYLLPRNTPVKPLIELLDEDEDLGPIRRPDAHDEKRKTNPKLAEEEDEMKTLLKHRI